MRWMARITRYAVSLGLMCLVTIGLAPFADRVNHTTVSLTYVLAILFIATLFGSRPALIASIVAVLSFNFFFLPPYYTLAVSHTENWVALAAFLITALVAGQLSSYARRRADESEARRREIEQLYSELTTAFEQASQAEALRQSDQLKSALLDAVTHDLRTPLTSIKASATTLMEEDIELDDESRRELLEIIDEETDRLNKFIGGMVDIAKVDAGKLELRKSPTSVSDLIMNVLDRAGGRPSGHELIIDVAPELPPIRVDGHSVEEVLYAVLDNAAKYSANGSKIRVSAERHEETVEISVEDQGRGVPEELRDRIFEKFYRIHDSDIHTTASGMGLGLAIARGISESQGLNLTVDDAPEPFRTRFRLSIPLDDGLDGK
jgi:K+-sensing histidine kinase KdpD